MRSSVSIRCRVEGGGKGKAREARKSERGVSGTNLLDLGLSEGRDESSLDDEGQVGKSVMDEVGRDAGRRMGRKKGKGSRRGQLDVSFLLSNSSSFDRPKTQLARPALSPPCVCKLGPRVW